MEEKDLLFAMHFCFYSFTTNQRSTRVYRPFRLQALLVIIQVSNIEIALAFKQNLGLSNIYCFG